MFERLAASLVGMNDLKNGREAMRHAIQLDAQNPALRQELVEIEYKIGGLPAAQTVAKSMLGAGDDPSTATLWVATALAREGKLADAGAVLADAEKTRPTEGLVVQHALVLQSAGDPARGAQALKTWLAGHPDSMIARRALADLLLSIKDYAGSQAEFEKLLAKTPNDVAVLDNLAWCYLQQGNPQARAVAERAHALAPLSSAIEDTLGWVMVAQGDAAGGMPYLKAAAYGLPQDANVQFHLAVALSRTGKVGDAREMLAKLANSDGGDAEAKAQATQYLKELK